MWATSLKKTSCCHPVESSYHSSCSVQMIVICGTLTPKQYIGLKKHYTVNTFLAENGLQMAITLLLKGSRTSCFGTLIQGPLSQSLTLVETSEAYSSGMMSSMADCAFLQMDDTSLQLMTTELDYGTWKLLYNVGLIGPITHRQWASMIV